MSPINKFVTTTMIVNMQIHSHKKRRERERGEGERGRERDEIWLLSLSGSFSTDTTEKEILSFLFGGEETGGKPNSTNMS